MSDHEEKLARLETALAEARAECERLRGILHRSYMLLPTPPGDPLTWVDHDIEPHVRAVADEYAIMQRQIAALNPADPAEKETK